MISGFPCSTASPSRTWRQAGTRGMTAKSDRIAATGTGEGKKIGSGAGQSTTSQLDDLFSSLSWILLSDTVLLLVI